MARQAEEFRQILANLEASSDPKTNKDWRWSKSAATKIRNRMKLLGINTENLPEPKLTAERERRRILSDTPSFRYEQIDWNKVRLVNKTTETSQTWGIQMTSDEEADAKAEWQAFLK